MDLANASPTFAEREVLGPLIARLREFGVTGEDREVEHLLANAHFDVQRALNLYFDRPEHFIPCVDEDGRVCAATGTLGRRDRWPMLRDAIGVPDSNGVTSITITSSSSCRGVDRKNILRTPHPPRTQAGKDRKNSACRVLQTGQEGFVGQAEVHYAAHGIAFQVDVSSMLQRDAATGQLVKVRRLKPGCWSVKKGSQKSNGWTPYPMELCMELERIYTGLLGNAACVGEESWECSAQPTLGSVRSLEALLEHESSLAPGEMVPGDAATVGDVVLEEAAQDPSKRFLAARLITLLARRQSLRCTPADARKAGLIVGSMVLLKAVMTSAPHMNLIGTEVFDQKYSGMKLNERGRKNGVRSLLARGMSLGSHAPSSKLLRKIEADSVPLFEARLFDAMMRAYPAMPEHIVMRIKAFLS